MLIIYAHISLSKQRYRSLQQGDRRKYTLSGTGRGWLGGGNWLSDRLSGGGGGR